MIPALAPLAFPLAGAIALLSLAQSARLGFRAWRALMETRPYD